MGSLDEGARNAVEKCMGVRSNESVLVVADESRYDIGRSILKAAKKVTPNAEIHLLKYSDENPVLPEEIAKSVEGADAAFWVTSSLHPIEMENRFVELVMKGSQRRLAQMSGITKQHMEEGMCVDYDGVERFTEKVYNLLSGIKEIRIEDNTICKKRTRLNLEINPEWKWVKSSGIIKKGHWSNLPDGEVSTAPFRVNGTVVTDLFGDYFDEKYGILDPKAYFEIEDSRIILNTLDCKVDVRKDLASYLSSGDNSNRTSEIALPTNYELMPKPKTGYMLQDEKARVHLGFANPYGEQTGADWKSEKHIDCILEGCDVTVDRRPIMKQGKYILDIIQ